MAVGIPFYHFWPPEIKREVVRLIWEFQDGHCAYCRRKMNLVEGKPKKYDDMTIDHVIPTSKGGGKLHVWNIVLACCLCNKTKKDNTWKPKIPIAYAYVEFPEKAIDEFDLCD
jgi:5-methylcytosine-specific restriction endonuclease McrA